jgi:hypothetical protein
MRIIFTLFAIVIVLVWGGLEMRRRDRGAAQVLFAFAALIALLLVAAFFGML